jgi:hypothetical protein
MSDLKKQINDWLKAGKDYDEGLLLLSRNSKNKAMVRILSMNPNPNKADKLLYELLKLADLGKEYIKRSKLIKASITAKKQVINKRTIVIKKGKQISKPVKVSGELKYDKTFNKLPLIVQELIKQKGKLFRKREDLHEKLTEINDNKPESIKIRKATGDLIEYFSERIEAIYQIELKFKETGALPPEDILVWNEDFVAKSKSQFPDFNKMTDIELTNRRTNLRSYLTKEENLLKFQSKSAKQTPDPMPSGPKREDLEKKIATRKEEIEEITRILESRVGESKGNKGK